VPWSRCVASGVCQKWTGLFLFRALTIALVPSKPLKPAVNSQAPIPPSPQKPGIQVISRAVAIIRALEDQPDGLSLGEIARRVALPRSTVQRIVGALENESVLIAAGPEGGVRLGPAIARWGANVSNDLGNLLRGYKRTFSEEINETIDISVIKGEQGLFVDQVLGNRRLQASSVIGGYFPFHCTAPGKVLLASMHKEERSRILNASLERFTEHTIVEAEVLQSQIEQFYHVGVTVDREEYADGISAIGTGLIDNNGDAFAISIPMPTVRFQHRREELMEKLVNFQRLLTQKLYFRPIAQSY